MLIIIKFLTGYIPQAIAFNLSIFAICKQKIHWQNFAISCSLLTLSLFLVRQMPISQGVNILMNMLALIAISYGINRLPINRTIIGCITVTLLMSFIELIWVGLMTIINGEAKLIKMLTDDYNKTLMAIPAMVVFTLLVILFYWIQTRKKRV